MMIASDLNSASFGWNLTKDGLYAPERSHMLPRKTDEVPHIWKEGDDEPAPLSQPAPLAQPEPDPQYAPPPQNYPEQYYEPRDSFNSGSRVRWTVLPLGCPLPGCGCGCFGLMLLLSILGSMIGSIFNF
jgi:hypothetical protein